MFIVVFVIMLPIYLKTSNALLAWQAGLAWAFIIGVIVLIGAFVGPTIRKYTPRAAMLGTLAGISIAFISMRPAFQMWEVPWIAFVSLAIVLISWTANVRLPLGHSGRARRRHRRHRASPGSPYVVRLERRRQPAEVSRLARAVRPPSALAERRRLHAASPTSGPLLVTAIPLGIYNFTEGMNNVESAVGGGRQLQSAQYPARRRHRRHRRARCSAAPSRPRSTSAIRDGRRSAGASATRSRPASLSRSSASSA